MMSSSLLSAARHPNPLSIFGSATKLWLDRGRGITLGTPPAVAAWADQSGNANDASQGTAGSRPSLGGTGLDFDGSDDHLVVGDHASLDFTTAMTIGMRLSFDTVVADQVALSKAQTTGGAWALQMVGSQSRLWVRFGAGGLPNYGRLTAFSSSTLYSLIVRYYGSGASNALKLRAWVNGSEDSGIAFTGTIPATLADVADALTIARWADAAQRMNGQIRALFIANVAASDAQVANATRYLNAA